MSAMLRTLFALLALLATPTILLAQELPTSRIDSVFASLNRMDGPGCTLGIFNNGEVAYTKGYGMANLEYGIALRPSSVFHIASISKQFTAFSVELLVSEGLVSWDDPIQKYVPEIPEYEWPITLRHLVHHTSGVRDQWGLLYLAGWRWEADLVTQANAIELMSRQTALNFQPGEQYLYSNSGFTLLAAVVERVSGQTLKEFSQDRIFGPLGMTSTHFHDDHETIVPNRAYGYRHFDDEGWKISIPDFAIVGASSLFTTVEDMAQWDLNLRDELIGDTALFERFFERGVLNNGDTITYAHGITKSRYRGQWGVGHGGADAGYRTNYLRFPDADVGIVSFCNFARANPGAYVRQVADIILEGSLDEAVEESEDEPEVDTGRWAEDFLRIAGFYREPRTDTPVRVWIQEGKARLNTGVGGGDSGALLVPEGDHRYALWPDGQTMTVTMDGNTPAVLSSERFDYQYVGPPVTDVDVAPYLGTYWSEELGTEYDIESGIESDSGDADFVLVHRVQDPASFRATYEDGFNSGGDWITFTRDPAGRVTGFTYSDGRVWKVRFVRR